MFFHILFYRCSKVVASGAIVDYFLIKMHAQFDIFFLQADAGGSPSLVARGVNSAQAASTGDQIQIQVPNEKVR